MAGHHPQPVGSGTLTYEGTFLSDKLQQAIVLDALRDSGLTGSDQQLPTAVQVEHGVNRLGKRIDYYLNYSGSPTNLTSTTPRAAICLRATRLRRAQINPCAVGFGHP